MAADVRQAQLAVRLAATVQPGRSDVQAEFVAGCDGDMRITETLLSEAAAYGCRASAASTAGFT
jgi:hypothetical protein